jgi:predicted AlkP superfamily phosphohydrolase/phosphomutase
MTRWTTGGIDWERTPAFTLRADLNGYIRLNLKGREPRGIVPREDADYVRERIREGLLSFRDADTGEPLIEEVVAASQVFAPGPRMDRLPDLIVRWRDTSGAAHAAVESPTAGRVERATPWRIPNGRSGNHRPWGYLIARGPGITPGTAVPEGADILDLAPTVLARLGARTASALAGRPIAALASA